MSNKAEGLNKVPVSGKFRWLNGPVRLYCFHSWKGCQKFWKLLNKTISQGNKMDWLGSHNLHFYSLNFDFKTWLWGCLVTGTCKKQAPWPQPLGYTASWNKEKRNCFEKEFFLTWSGPKFYYLAILFLTFANILLSKFHFCF